MPFSGFYGSTIATRKGPRGLTARVYTSKKLNKRQKRQVKRLISARQEKKMFPFYLPAINVSTTATITDLSQIQQGDAVNNRSGNSINLKKIDLRYALVAADTTQVVRVMIIQYKSDSAAGNPVEADIFQDVTNAIPLSSINYNNRLEFNILYDKVHYMDLDSNGAEGRHVILTPKKFKNLIQYNGSATTGYNKIYSVVWSDSGGVSHPTITMYGTLIYTDS